MSCASCSPQKLLGSYPPGRGEQLRDNCVSWSGRSLQIPAQQHRHHYVRVTVRVHEYPDGKLAIFDGPRCLARYDANGALLDDPLSRAA